MKVQGYDLNAKLSELKREQPYSDVTAKHYGMPVTTTSFLWMLFQYWLRATENPENPIGDIFWVEFSKASLFRILAQEKCEFVRFYFAVPDSGVQEASLALEGIMEGGIPIKLPSILRVASTMDEHQTTDLETNGETLLDDPEDSQPGHEERGNGGPPFAGFENIGSLKSFIAEKKLELNGTFEEFLKAYYEHAQEVF